jgi:hypothetical protein
MGPVTGMLSADSSAIEVVATKEISGLQCRDSPPINRSSSPNQLTIPPTTKSPATQKNNLAMSDVTEIKGKYDRV